MSPHLLKSAVTGHLLKTVAGHLANRPEGTCDPCGVGDVTQNAIDVTVAAGNCTDAEGLYGYSGYAWSGDNLTCWWTWTFTGAVYDWVLKIYYCRPTDTWGAEIYQSPQHALGFGDDSYQDCNIGALLCVSLITEVSIDCDTGLLSGTFTLDSSSECETWGTPCTDNAVCVIQ